MSYGRRASHSLRDLAATFRGISPRSSVSLESKFPRLVERSLPFHQSRNKIHIQHRNARQSLYKLLQHNWFHVFLRLKTSTSLSLLLVLWTLLISFYALLYYIADRAHTGVDCGLTAKSPEGYTPISYNGAFGFSLETATTVGYSLPGSSNALFEKCTGVTIVIYLQMMTSMLFNAFLFTFFYSRLAKSEARAIQVVFADKCVIHVTQRGTLMLQIRVYDVDSGHGIVEAHIRLYALLKHKDTGGHPKLEQLRIMSPNDELGSMLFLNIPTIVSHEIDYYSPLYDNDTFQHECDAYRLSSGGMFLREVDSVTGNREEIMCPICGGTFGDFRRLRKHIQYSQLTEESGNVPVAGSHQELQLDEIPLHPSRPTLQHIRNTLPLQELICVVEGTDPLTSGTFQALHSYMPNNIEWDSCFAPCLTSTTALESTFVDLQLFHQVQSLTKNHTKLSTIPDHSPVYYDNGTVQAEFPMLRREMSTPRENEDLFCALRRMSKYGTVMEEV